MFSRTNTKILITGILGLLLVSTAASASLTSQEEGVVWLNSQESFPEVQASCDGKNISAISIGDKNLFSDGDQNVTLDTSDFQNNKLETGSRNITLKCSGEPEINESIDFAKLNFKSDDSGDGVGFVGQVMRDESVSLGNRRPISLEYNFGEFTGYDLESWSISLSNGLDLSGENAYTTNDDDELVLYPMVNSYPEGLKSNIDIKRTGEFSRSYELNRDVDDDFFIHDWRADRVGSNPGIDMTYEQVSEGDYEFYLDMNYRDQNGLPASTDDVLTSRNFRLTVKKDENSRSDVNSDFQTVEIGGEKMKELPILDAENPVSNSDANYRVFIDEYSKLDDLSAGKYKFILEVVYDSEEPAKGKRSFKVDETIVDKTSEFSGVVLNSGGSGVVTEMVLRDEERDTKQNIVTDGTGGYSTEIDSSSNQFNVNAKFYETSGDTGSIPDGEVTLSGAKLENSDLGPGGSAIRFEYLESPDIGIEGINPVNMMMVKFGYPVNDIDDLDMAFDSGKVDPQNMKVFECDAWNFEGGECMSNWGNALSEDDVSVNPATWTVNLQNTDLYSIEGDKILMNAYVIGRNSRITLQDSMDVTSEVKSGEDFEASGVLVDENGDRVTEANVNLSLIGTDKEWSTNTDSTGTFEFSEELDVDRGNYQLRLETSKSPYESFEMESEATINVYYGKGLSVSSESNPVISPGQEYDIEYTLENTGQTPISDIEIDISGIPRNRYELNPSTISSIDVDESKTVVMTLDPPEEFQTPPAIEFSASGDAEGEEVSAKANTLVSFDEASTDTKAENQTDDSQTDSQQSSSNSIPDGEEITRMTGEFIESQSQMNLALGLILVFAAILAVAVKNKDEDSRDMRGRGQGRGQSRVQAPQVAPQEDEEEPGSESEPSEASEKEEESAEKESSEDSESSDEESNSVECDVCGETFDTESGMNLHKQALH